MSEIKVQVDLFGNLNKWVDIPGFNLQVMVKDDEAIGVMYFREKPDDHMPEV